jgi:hypothetical protein
LSDPSEALTITHLLHDGAHEELNWADIPQRDLALASGLPQAKSMTQMVFRDSAGCVNLVTKDEEGDFRELLDSKEGVQFSLRLRETFDIRGVDEENDCVDFGEVVAPETTSCEAGKKLVLV